jgi:large conductance mechanosensitive channel
MLKEFKEFAMRGNVIDLAVGIIIGAAFTTVVNSLVNDILMPPIGKLANNVDFKDLFIALDGQSYQSLAAAKTAGAPVIGYGLFINSILNFLIVAFAVFLLVKQINRLKKPAEAAPSTKQCPYCANNVPAIAVRCGFCTSELKATLAAG